LVDVLVEVVGSLVLAHVSQRDRRTAGRPRNLPLADLPTADPPGVAHSVQGPRTEEDQTCCYAR
jgi:hypothetical protein